MPHGQPPIYTNVWGAGVPGTFSSDFASVVLGLRGQVAADGAIIGVRFFRHLQDGADHVGLLLNPADLSLIDCAPFHRVAAAGAGADAWQSAYFRRFHELVAGDRFVVAVLFQGGAYYADANALSSGPMISGDLRFTQDGDGGANGMYAYSGIVPTNNFNSTAYGIDLIYRANQ